MEPIINYKQNREYISNVDYLNFLWNDYFPKQLQLSYKYKGILREIELNSEEETKKTLIEKGIIVNNDEHLFYKADFITELMEHIHYSFRYFLVNNLSDEQIQIENELKYLIKVEDKIEHLNKEISKTLIDLKSNENSNLFTFFHSKEIQLVSGYRNWIELIGNEFYYKSIDGTFSTIVFESLKDVELDFLKSEIEQSSYYDYEDEKTNAWYKTEYLIHRLEFLRNFQNLVLNSNYVNEEVKVRINNNLTMWDYKFMEGISDQLLDIKYIKVIEDLMMKVPFDQKNIPFFTAFFKFFSGKDGKGTKKYKIFIDSKPQNFISLVNDCYDLCMKRLTPEAGSRPDDLRDLFRSIYEKRFNS